MPSQYMLMLIGCVCIVLGLIYFLRRGMASIGWITGLVLSAVAAVLAPFILDKVNSPLILGLVLGGLALCITALSYFAARIFAKVTRTSPLESELDEEIDLEDDIDLDDLDDDELEEEPIFSYVQPSEKLRARRKKGKKSAKEDETSSVTITDVNDTIAKETLKEPILETVAEKPLEEVSEVDTPEMATVPDIVEETAEQPLIIEEAPQPSESPELAPETADAFAQILQDSLEDFIDENDIIAPEPEEETTFIYEDIPAVEEIEEALDNIEIPEELFEIEEEEIENPIILPAQKTVQPEPEEEIVEFTSLDDMGRDETTASAKAKGDRGSRNADALAEKSAEGKTTKLFRTRTGALPSSNSATGAFASQMENVLELCYYGLWDKAVDELRRMQDEATTPSQHKQVDLTLLQALYNARRLPEAVDCVFSILDKKYKLTEVESARVQSILSDLQGDNA